MRKLILASLLIIVSACTPEPEPGHIPFRTNGGIPTVAVELNGEMKRLLIDTGASYSILDLDVARDMKLRLIEDKESVSGIGGTVKQFIISSGLEVTHRDTILHARFKAIDFPVGRKIGVVGVLGTSYFKRHKMVIDYRTNTIHK